MLPQLTYLVLSESLASGAIPEFQSKKLEVLVLNGLKLGGRVPALPASITSLYLHNNRFVWLFSLGASVCLLLIHFVCCPCRLSCTIGADTLPSIQGSLVLVGNSFQSSLPAWMAKTADGTLSQFTSQAGGAGKL